MTIFAIVLGVIYFVVGMVKVIGVKHMADQFVEFKLGRVGMLIVGGLEVVAAICLQVESVRSLAALGMVLMMLGAIYFHLKVKHAPGMAAPAAVVLCVSGVFLALSL